MGNASVNAASSGADQLAETLRVTFQAASGSGGLPAREIKRLNICTGPASGSFMINIPFVHPMTDELAFNIALQASGPGAALKLLTRAEVAIFGSNGKTSKPMMCGHVVNRHRCRGELGRRRSCLPRRPPTTQGGAA